MISSEISVEVSTPASAVVALPIIYAAIIIQVSVGSFCYNLFNNLCRYLFLNYKRKWFKQPQPKFTSK
jgi:hypothetical protein